MPFLGQTAMPAVLHSASHEAPLPVVHSAGRARKKGGAPLDLGVLNERLGYFVRRLQVWIFQDFIRALDPVGIGPAQYSVLIVTEANPGLSQSDLCQLLGIERARLVRLLDGLEKRGLTRRLPSRSDRRSHELFLTRDGQKRLKRIKALAAEHEAHVIEKIGPQECAMMIEILKDFDPVPRPEKGSAPVDRREPRTVSIRAKEK